MVRADTSAGDADPDTGRIYIPLNTAAADRIQAHYVLMECREGDDGEKRALQDVAADVMENDGSYWDTDKEVMRATMLVRAAFDRVRPVSAGDLPENLEPPHGFADHRMERRGPASVF